MYNSLEALERLDRYLNWRRQPVPQFDLGQIARENRECLRYLGGAIADAILSVLSPGELTADMAGRIFDRQEDSLSICRTYPELTRLLPSEEDRAVNGIIKAMISRDRDDAWSGFNALNRWVRGAQRGNYPAVPRRLIEVTLSVAETRREPGLLHALDISRHLTNAGILNTDDMARLVGALGLIYVETAYDAAQSERTIDITTLTLVRATALRLAHSLNTKGMKHRDLERWLECASVDPMPEVRFALDTPFE
jgi:hypothetical protein